MNNTTLVAASFTNPKHARGVAKLLCLLKTDQKLFTGKYVSSAIGKKIDVIEIESGNRYIVWTMIQRQITFQSNGEPNKKKFGTNLRKEQNFF